MTYRLRHDDAEHESVRHEHRRRRRHARRDAGRRAARRTMSVLPTMFTLGNLLCGFLALFIASRPMQTVMPLGMTPLTMAALLIFLGMLFDALDGRIARLSGHTSELGGQLDSMADMVTFGVAPAFIAVQLVGIGTPFLTERVEDYFNRGALIIAGIYVACAALRLARFNLEVESAEVEHHMSFTGLPSPGAAGTVVSLVLLHQGYWATYTKHTAAFAAGETPLSVRISAAVLMLVMLLASLSMVSRLHYVHVLNRYVRGKAPFGYVVKAVLILLLLMIFPKESLAAGFVIYAASAPVAWCYQRVAGKKSASVGNTPRVDGGAVAEDKKNAAG